ncbi:MAG: AMP-binding protein [Deltaproteobacteria bacterium]|nr:AMP-binding protein [Deltaproteobacteria bacterium]
MSALEYRHSAAVQEPGTIVPYSAIVHGARACASALLEGRDSLAGQRVALLASPGAGFVEAFFGILYAGGCAVVLSTLHPPAETAFFCSDAQVETILVSASLAERVAGLGPRILTTDEARRHAPGALPSPRAGDPALQLYTSGTTGKPKGAVLTHGNLGVQQELLGEAWEMRPDDVLVHALPLHHMHGLCIALLTTLGAGACALMLPQFEARSVWESLARGSVLMAVPTMYSKLLAAFEQVDPSTRERWAQSARQLRLATSGSAALPVSVGEKWRALAGAYPVERFGMTELGVGATNPIQGDRRPGTVGRPLRTVDLKVVDDEMWIAGPSVFAEYYRRPEATAEAFVVEDGKRWFRTGDTVAVDPDGYVRILGRTSVDILKSGGYKLSALEIEEALRECAAVAEVAVVGLPDEVYGERVVACVVARTGQEAQCSEESLRAFARERLAPYKVPRAVVIMDALPRNAMGKVLKRELVRRVGSGS